MNMFNFDFDSGKPGVISISSQWWLYVIVAGPMTAATFAGFWVVTRKGKLKDKEEEQPAETPAS